MKNYILIILLALLSPVFSFAEDSYIDSLLTSLKNEKIDSIRIDLMNTIAEAYLEGCVLDSAEIFANAVIDHSQSNNLESREAMGKHLLGYILHEQERDAEALSCILEAKAYYDNSNSEYDRFWTYYYLASINYFIGATRMALTHFDSAKTYLDETDTTQVYNLNLRLGSLFWYEKDFEKSKKYFFRNIKLTEYSNDLFMKYGAYADLGLMYNDDQKSDSAIYYLEMALPVIEKEDPDWAYCIKGCLGTNYKNLGDCQTALKYYEASLARSDNYEDSEECLSFLEIAYCYSKMGNEEKAEHFNKVALGLFHKMKDPKLKGDAYKEIVKLYKNKQDFERAFYYLEMFKSFEDSLYQIETTRAIEEFDSKYKSREQKNLLELQTLQLSKQRNLIIGGISLLALLGALVFLAWRNILHRKKSNALLTERNKHLEELDTTKSRFFSNISHELRTPLTLVTAPLEKIIQKVKDKAVENDLRLVHRNSQKLLVLVNEILDLSKLESGQMQLEPTRFELEEVLRRIFFAFQSYADIRNVKLEFVSHLSRQVWVNTDVSKLEKILNNLVSNAIKYSKPESMVKIALSLNQADPGINQPLNSKGLFEIKVMDTGKGIHEDDLPKIFNRFYQSNSDQLLGGTGIGLALTKELVHLMSGTLSVESELGKGSIFYVKLPLEVVNTPNDQLIGIKVPELANDHIVESTFKEDIYTPIVIDGVKPKILIVEDNPEMSRFLKQTLSEYYECHHAYDGIKALKKLEKEHFDLISSDVMMPHMDGFEFLENVRQTSTVYKNTPFIMLTARSLETDKLEGFQLGVDDYITKPFSTKELVARIDNLLKNKIARTHAVNTQEANAIESEDRKILKEAERTVLENLSDTKFGVQQLAKELAISSRSLSRLINRLTGLSPVGFIREIRLQKAWQMLQRRQYLRVSEVCLEVGIDNPSYFNRKFKERFGLTPKAVLGKVVV